jgi:hypothetical protein
MFSLFYFSTVDELLDGNKYRLYLEGAKFADRHGTKHRRRRGSLLHRLRSCCGYSAGGPALPECVERPLRSANEPKHRRGQSILSFHWPCILTHAPLHEIILFTQVLKGTSRIFH